MRPLEDLAYVIVALLVVLIKLKLYGTVQSQAQRTVGSCPSDQASQDNAYNLPTQEDVQAACAFRYESEAVHDEQNDQQAGE